MATLPRCAILLLCALLLGAAPADAATRRLGERVLRVGAHGDDVRALQRLLTRSGFRAHADGAFGAGTRTAVRRFQRAATLRPTGVAGPATVRLLRAAARSVAAAPPAGDGGASFGAVPARTVPATATAAPAPAPVATPAAAGAVGRARLTGDGRAVAPAGAPAQVVAMIAAANRIATLPYRYGGGHGDFEDDAYDCSGSVSYALHGAGLLDATMDSGSLAAWGRAGAGRWVTIYANAGHVYMEVAGLRFDTSGQKQTGSRWQDAGRSSADFTVRHPAGL